jgi:hypothetical protein
MSSTRAAAATCSPSAPDPPGVEAGEAEPAHDFVDELIASTADRHHDASSGLSARVAGPADADG